MLIWKDLLLLGQAYANLNGTCASPVALAFSSPNSPSTSGSYHPGTQMIATFSFVNATAPAGTQYQIQITSPTGVSVVGPQTSPVLKFVLRSVGVYTVQGRVISSTGVTGPWFDNNNFIVSN